MSNLAVVNGSAISTQNSELTRDQVELLKATIAKGTTDDELSLFTSVCNRTGLDPFLKQIYPVKRWSQKDGREVMSIQVSIDGMRSIAENSGEYEGQTPMYWCGEDGVWVDVWLKKESPSAAKVGLYKRNFREPLWAVAKFDSYVQLDKNGQPTRFWKQMPDVMIGKCAESLGLRKAFPTKLSKLYTSEEMGQHSNDSSDSISVEAKVIPMPVQKAELNDNLARLAFVRQCTGHTQAQAKAIALSMELQTKDAAQWSEGSITKFCLALMADWSMSQEVFNHLNHAVNALSLLTSNASSDPELWELWIEDVARRKMEDQLENAEAAKAEKQVDGENILDEDGNPF